jgi:hypothetical protein
LPSFSGVNWSQYVTKSERMAPLVEMLPTNFFPVEPPEEPELASGLEPELASGLDPELAPELVPELAPELVPEPDPELAPEPDPELAPELAAELEPPPVLEAPPSPDEPELTPEPLPEVAPELAPELVPLPSPAPPGPPADDAHAAMRATAGGKTIRVYVRMEAPPVPERTFAPDDAVMGGAPKKLPPRSPNSCEPSRPGVRGAPVIARSNRSAHPLRVRGGSAQRLAGVAVAATGRRDAGPVTNAGTEHAHDAVDARSAGPAVRVDRATLAAIAERRGNAPHRCSAGHRGPSAIGVAAASVADHAVGQRLRTRDAVAGVRRGSATIVVASTIGVVATA